MVARPKKKSADLHGADAVPTSKRAKTAKRKREIEADTDHPLVSWLTGCRPPPTAEAIARMAKLSGGPPLPLLEVAPSRASLRGLAPGSVLVLCSSAVRCVEVIRALKATLRCTVAKLFAKHLKLAAQLEELKVNPHPHPHPHPHPDPYPHPHPHPHPHPNLTPTR